MAGMRGECRFSTLTEIASASIALSAGVSTVVFAAVKSVLLDPLPFEPSQLVQFRSEFPRMRQQSHGDWVVWNGARRHPARLAPSRSRPGRDEPRSRPPVR